jgi:NADPH:quinone reductase-like Zn-dependent oxidoreductase
VPVKALVQTGNGGYDVLQVQERPDPPVGPGEIRIEVKAAGVNFADTMARLGLYPDAPKPPCTMGYEVAGLVESVGEGVTAYAVGDRVLAGTRFGGQAELVTVPTNQAQSLPERLSFEQGAAFPVNYGTAYAALILMGGLRQGDRVLIHAAAGGVGTAATQVARNVGAEIFGTASAAKHEAIRAQGVTHPIDYRSSDFEVEAMRLSGGEGVDLVIDALGPTSFRKDYRLLRPGGRLVMYGLSEVAGERGRDIPALLRGLAKMPLATIPWWKSLALMNENKGIFGLNMLKWWDREGNLDRLVEPLMADLRAGRLEPVVAEAFPFERAGEAHKLIEERRNVGKVVLFPS